MPRGGARKGSGRPLKYGRPLKSVTADLPIDLVQRLDSIAHQTSSSRTFVMLTLLTKQLEDYK